MPLIAIVPRGLAMLEVKDIIKIFPGVKALDSVSVAFQRGEIHALMGENGAGKSTLMKILTGIYKPDAGEVFLDGQQVHLTSYHDAIEHEIAMVFQEIQVIPKSTVAENIVLDKMDKFTNRFGFIDWARINATAQKYLDLVELNVNPTDKIGNLTVAQKQLIQIAKAL